MNPTPSIIPNDERSPLDQLSKRNRTWKNPNPKRRMPSSDANTTTTDAARNEGAPHFRLDHRVRHVGASASDNVPAMATVFVDESIHVEESSTRPSPPSPPRVALQCVLLPALLAWWYVRTRRRCRRICPKFRPGGRGIDAATATICHGGTDDGDEVDGEGRHRSNMGTLEDEDAEDRDAFAEWEEVVRQSIHIDSEIKQCRKISCTFHTEKLDDTIEPWKVYDRDGSEDANVEWMQAKGNSKDGSQWQQPSSHRDVPSLMRAASTSLSHWRMRVLAVQTGSGVGVGNGGYERRDEGNDTSPPHEDYQEMSVLEKTPQQQNVLPVPSQMK